jgi:hypothetical protein
MEMPETQVKKKKQPQAQKLSRRGIDDTHKATHTALSSGLG